MRNLRQTATIVRRALKAFPTRRRRRPWPKSPGHPSRVSKAKGPNPIPSTRPVTWKLAAPNLHSCHAIAGEPLRPLTKLNRPSAGSAAGASLKRLCNAASSPCVPRNRTGACQRWLQRARVGRRRRRLDATAREGLGAISATSRLRRKLLDRRHNGLEARRLRVRRATLSEIFAVNGSSIFSQKYSAQHTFCVVLLH